MADQTDTTLAESPIDHMLVREYDGGFRQVHHDTPEADRAEAGFDLTDFGSAEAFEKLLADLDLNPAINYNEEYYMENKGWVPDPQSAKIQKDSGEDRDYGVFVWANQNLALVTGNNPITGEYSRPDMRSDETGYASYMGLSGDPEAVETAWDAIIEEATHIKGRDRNDRQFI